MGSSQSTCPEVNISYFKDGPVPDRVRVTISLKSDGNSDI
jgi:hypothetical protein